MRQLPLYLQVYIVAVIIISGLILALFFPGLLQTEFQDAVLAIAAVLALPLAATQVIPVTHRTGVTVSVGISFASVLLLERSLATWVTALGMAIAYAYLNLYLKRWKWYNGAFNVGAYILTTAASAVVYENMRVGAGDLLLSSGNVAALFAAGLTYFFINTGLVALASAFRHREAPWHIWVSSVDQVAAEYLTLILLAVLTAVAYKYNKWALLLVVLPVVIVYYSLKTSQELRTQTIEAVEVLADAIDARDPYTHAHSQRVSAYAERIARKLGISGDEVEIISRAARVHDLGKMAVSNEILYKPGKFTQEERNELEQHVQTGAEIVGRFPQYQEGWDIVRHHHERYDGTGYPDGLAGEEIPMGARILAVADAWDAMTTDRPYRDALSMEDAIDELKEYSGTQFDPLVVGAFLSLPEEERLLYVDSDGEIVTQKPAQPKRSQRGEAAQRVQSEEIAEDLQSV